jgi:copper homeostasis protein
MDPVPADIRFEVCLEGIDSVVAAAAGGAHRVELCANLTEGGTTPSLGTVAAARAAVDLDIMVMIRPRGGDFCYTERELEVMLADIERIKPLGVAGFVFGCLLPDGTVDVAATRRLIAAARPGSVTFHRAFDVTADPLRSLETLIELGVDRVLTSGHAPSVPEGLDLLRQLVEAAADRIIILPGAGITPDNVADVLARTGCREFHATAWRELESPMRYRNEAIYMGIPGLPEYSRMVTDAEVVQRFLAAAPAR